MLQVRQRHRGRYYLGVLRDGEPFGAVGVAHGEWLLTCGDGGNRRLLEADLVEPVHGEFELVLANSAHVKNVPGRKSDVNDATWLAELLAHA